MIRPPMSCHFYICHDFDEDGFITSNEYIAFESHPGQSKRPVDFSRAVNTTCWLLQGSQHDLLTSPGQSTRPVDSSRAVKTTCWLLQGRQNDLLTSPGQSTRPVDFSRAVNTTCWLLQGSQHDLLTFPGQSTRLLTRLLTPLDVHHAAHACRCIGRPNCLLSESLTTHLLYGHVYFCV